MTERIEFTGTAHGLLPVSDVDHDRIRLSARHEIVTVLRRKRRTWIHTVLEEFPTYYPVARVTRWFKGEPFIQVSRRAIVNLRAIEEVWRSGDRLYRLRLRDRAAPGSHLVEASVRKAKDLLSL